MKLIERLLNSVARAPDDGGGTGGGGSNTPPAPAAGEGAAPVAETPSAPATTPPANGGAAPPAPVPEGPYKAEGLPDHLVGKSDKETIDNISKALKGYRDRDAKGGGVPEDVKDYLGDGATVPDVAKGYFDALKTDPVFEKIAATAKENGIPKAAFGALLGAFLEGNAAAGMFEPLIDVAAERAALVPDAAKSLPKTEQDAAIDKRMNDNSAWLTAMQAQGMPKDAADYAQMMLFDTAKGHQFVEFFRGRIEGANNNPLSGGNPAGEGGASMLKGLKTEMVTNPKYQVDSREYDAKATKELQARILQLAST